MNDSTLHSDVQRRLKFSDFKDGLKDFRKNMTAGKFILCPDEEDLALEAAKADDPMFEEYDLR